MKIQSELSNYTKYLVILSLCLSMVSLFLSRYQIAQEIYPFAPWKLFSMPSGGNLNFEAFKAYGIKGSDTLKISLNDEAILKANKRLYAIKYYISKIESGEDLEAKKKLRVLFEELEPATKFEKFILKKEFIQSFKLSDNTYQPESNIYLIIE